MLFGDSQRRGYIQTADQHKSDNKDNRFQSKGSAIRNQGIIFCGQQHAIDQDTAGQAGQRPAELVRHAPYAVLPGVWW